MSFITSTPDSFSSLKKVVHSYYPDIRSSHLSEALASAAGFKSHAALLANLKSQEVSKIDGFVIDRFLPLKEVDFLDRLIDFGYQPLTLFSSTDKVDHPWLGGVSLAFLNFINLKPLMPGLLFENQLYDPDDGAPDEGLEDALADEETEIRRGLLLEEVEVVSGDDIPLDPNKEFNDFSDELAHDILVKNGIISSEKVSNIAVCKYCNSDCESNSGEKIGVCDGCAHYLDKND
jgi:hypothetical protein